MAQGTEEVAICRVCRGEATPEEPLFYPCRCSGSIKYVHQVCLEEWLAHSNKRYCELCGHEYAFSPLYDPNMPESIPKGIIVKQMLANVTIITLGIIRSAVVLGMWTFVLPYLVYWIVRVFIWAAKAVAYSMSSSDMFLDNFTAAVSDNSTTAVVAAASMRFKGFNTWNEWYLASMNNATAAPITSRTGIMNDANQVAMIMYSATQVLLRSCTRLVGSMTGIAISEAQINDAVEVAVELMAKTFEGSLVTLMSVIVFFVLFVLRDWIATNAPLEDEFIEEFEEQQQAQNQQGGEDNDDSDDASDDGEGEEDDEEAIAHEQPLLAVAQAIAQPRAEPAIAPVHLQLQAQPIVAENPQHRPQFEQPAFDLLAFDDIPPGERPVRQIRRRVSARQHTFSGHTGEQQNNDSWVVADGLETEERANVAEQVPLGSEAVSDELAVEATHDQGLGDALAVAPSASENSASSHSLSIYTRAEPRIARPLIVDYYVDSELDSDLDLYLEHVSLAGSVTGTDGSDREINEQINDTDIGDNAHGSQSSGENHIQSAVSDEGASLWSFIAGDPSTPEHVAAFEAAPSPISAPESSHGVLAQTDLLALHNTTQVIGGQDLIQGADQPIAVREQELIQPPQQPNLPQMPIPRELGEPDHIEDGDARRQQQQQQEQPQQQQEVPLQQAQRAGGPDNAGFVEPAAVAGQAPPAAQGAVEADFDENFGDFEAADGVLEAMGLRGPIINAVQYFMLLLMVIVLVLTICVWLPIILGRIFLTIDPLQKLLYLVHVFSTVVDTVGELLLDKIMPLVWVMVRPIFVVTTNLVGPFVANLVALAVPAVKGTLLAGNGSMWDKLTSPEMQALVVERLRQPWVIQMLFPWIAAESGADHTPTHMVASAVISATVSAAAASVTGVTTPAALAENLAKTLRLQPWESELWSKFIHWGIPIDKLALYLQSVKTALTLGDRIVLIGIGNLVSIYMAWLTVKYTPPRLRRAAAYQGARMLLIMSKIISFIFIEIVLFPMICGYCLDISITPLLPESVRSSHYSAIMNHTMSARALFWMVGVFFMIHFARFVLYSRQVMRPGLLWFIRDPNDPEFHPMREALEDGTISQQNKIVRSALMYCSILLVCFGVPSMAAVTLAPNLFPIQWDTTAKLSDYPTNALFAVLALAVVARWGRPYDVVRVLFERWWKFVARETRLSEFIIGQRDVLDEGRWVVCKAPWMPVLLSRLWMPTHIVTEGFDQLSQSASDKARIGSVAGALPTSEFNARLQYKIDIALADKYPWVEFVLDGQNVRAPTKDTVSVVVGRKMLVPVDDDGRPVEDRFDYEAADYADQNSTGRSGQEGGEHALPALERDLPPPAPESSFRDLRFKPEQHSVIFVPPGLRARVGAFVALGWLAIASFVVTTLISSIVVGKRVCVLMGDMPRNDLIALAIGLLVLLVSSVVVYQAGSYVSVYFNIEGGLIVRVREARRELRQSWMAAWKMLVTGFVFFGVLPALYGLVVEVYLVAIARTHLERSGSQYVFVRTPLQAMGHNWVFSAMHMWLVVSVLRFFPGLRVTRNVDRFFTGPPHTWHVWRGIVEIAMPIAGLSLGFSVLPFVLTAFEMWFHGTLTADSFWSVALLKDVKVLSRCSMASLLAALTAGAVWQACIVYKRWSRLARDRVYLVGQQLHNLQNDADDLGDDSGDDSGDGMDAAANEVQVEVQVEDEDENGWNDDSDAAADDGVDVNGDTNEKINEVASTVIEEGDAHNPAAEELPTFVQAKNAFFDRCERLDREFRIGVHLPPSLDQVKSTMSMSELYSYKQLVENVGLTFIDTSKDILVIIRKCRKLIDEHYDALVAGDVDPAQSARRIKAIVDHTAVIDQITESVASLNNQMRQVPAVRQFYMAESSTAASTEGGHGNRHDHRHENRFLGMLVE
ncbi:hypothetical protein LPJ66_000211 [Kickxella alabastrina]|uniref:Uncharacterized protein n=1 Tax=Kickxella alabastrina TaxID=61397 RepID=A0ACC1IWV8_9FUNG|nr:hypothetical protein LPJ66_000211 [Kickxella alabastrina]